MDVFKLFLVNIIVCKNNKYKLRLRLKRLRIIYYYLLVEFFVWHDYSKIFRVPIPKIDDEYNKYLKAVIKRFIIFDWA